VLKIDINLVFTVINVIVLYLLLRKFLFKPFSKMLANRKKMIQDDFDTAAAAKTSAEDMKAQYEKQIQQIQIERDQILTEAKKQADQVYQKRMADAEADAKALAEKTRRQLEEERRQTERELQDAVADLAMKATKKALESGAPLSEGRYGTLR
jgi:F-type H+-transporting ATPase subunit b